MSATRTERIAWLRERLKSQHFDTDSLIDVVLEILDLLEEIAPEP